MVSKNTKSEIKVSATEKGTEYELMLQKIYASMLEQDEVDAVVERKKKLKTIDGGTVEAEIYWEFKRADVTLKIVAQAKDERHNIKQNELFAFHKILENIPGQPRGLFITRTGFQKGARDYANRHEIGIYTLRVPSDYTEDELKQFAIPQGEFRIAVFRHFFGFSPDTDWTSTHRIEITQQQLNEQILTDYEDPMKIMKKMVFLDENGRTISTLQNIESMLFQPLFDLPPGKSREIRTHEFNKPTFVKTKNPKFPVVKINAVIIVRDTNVRDPFKMEANKLVKAILADLTTGNVRLFNNEFKADNSISFRYSCF